MANSPTNALNHPLPAPKPVVSARGNVGASQPHGTAKLTPASQVPRSNVPSAPAAPVVSARGNVGASQPHGTAKLGLTSLQQMRATAVAQAKQFLASTIGAQHNVGKALAPGFMGSTPHVSSLPTLPPGTPVSNEGQSLMDILGHPTGTFSILAKNPAFVAAANAPVTPQKVTSMVKFANQQLGKPYIWGGGHGGFGPMTGYDCSGFVSAVLHAGGYLTAPQTTDTLPSQMGLAHGPGKFVTIYDKTNAQAGGQGHVIIDLNGQFYEAGGGGGSRTGGVQGGLAGGVAKIGKPDPAYLSTFQTIMHPLGLGPARPTGPQPPINDKAHQMATNFISHLGVNVAKQPKPGQAVTGGTVPVSAQAPPPSLHGLTARGQALSPSQLAAAARIAQIGKQLHASPTAIAGVEADAIYESTLNPNAPGNPKYGGLLAGNVGQGVFPGGAAGADAEIRAAFQGGKGFQAGGAIALANSGDKNLLDIASRIAGVGTGTSGQHAGQTGSAAIPPEAARIAAALLKIPMSQLPSIASSGGSSGSSSASGGSSGGASPSSGGSAPAPAAMKAIAQATSQATASGKAPGSVDWNMALIDALLSSTKINLSGKFTASDFLGAAIHNAESGLYGGPNVSGLASLKL